MDKFYYATIAYGAGLMVLFTCILFVRIGMEKVAYTRYLKYAIRLFGILPGFVAVIYGIYVQFFLNGSYGLAIMSAGLLLEIGAVQLLQILKKIEEKPNS